MNTIERSSIFVFWTIIIALSAYFFYENVAVYLRGYRSEAFQKSAFWVSTHLIGGSIALFFGPIQFWNGIRNKYLSFHRTAGKIYIIGAFIAGLSALRLSLISSCVTCRVSLLIVSVLVIVTTFAALWSIKNKDVAAHRQFMIRSYICVFSFVAVRVGGLIPLEFVFGVIEDPVFKRTVHEYFFSFMPIILGEIFLIWIPTLNRIQNKNKRMDTFD